MVFYMGYVMQSFKNPVPYVPTNRKTIRKMIEAAGIKNGDRIIDIGSGTGRIVFAVAKKHDGEVIGIEKSPILYLISRLKLLFQNKKKIKFVKGDFTQYPLNGINIVMCFLTPEGLSIIEKKLTDELSAGAKIVSHLFPLKNATGFKETKVLLNKKKKPSYLFIYNKL